MLLPPYAPVLDEIRDSGYAGTKFGDWTEASALRRELDARQLRLVGAFVPVAFANKTAHALGAEVTVKDYCCRPSPERSRQSTNPSYPLVGRPTSPFC